MSLKVSREAIGSYAYIDLNSARIVRSIELGGGVIADLDEFDCLVGLEILDLKHTPAVRDITRSVHVREADELTLQSDLLLLSQLSFTTGSLTPKSRVLLKSSPEDKLRNSHLA